MQRGQSSTCLIKTIHVNTTKYKTTKVKTETVLSGAMTKTEDNHPQNTQRTWLPKYGSQSETTTDS